MTSGGVCTGFVFAAHCFQTFSVFFFFFFFNDTATTEIYTLSLHDALPIWLPTANRDLYGFVALAPQVSTASGLSGGGRSEEHTSELQSLAYLVCRLLLEKKKKIEQSQCTDLHVHFERITFTRGVNWYTWKT